MDENIVKTEDEITNERILGEAGIEIEQDAEVSIKVPFDTKMVDLHVDQITIFSLASRIAEEEIDLMPDFQRQGNLWSETKMSRLIESILIRLPLPAIYMDVADDDRWIVVDGLQRLSTIKRFMVDKNLKLRDLEFLKKLEGKKFDDLDKKLQRRIRETNVVVIKIKKGTPKKVLTSLFHRINTGGTKLTSQEIRNALNQGKASTFLNDISIESWFKEVIKVSPKRMLDKELILRFMAFYRQGFMSYKPSLQQFLDNEMEYLNHDSIELSKERKALKETFRKSLTLSKEIFGDKAFTKALIDSEKKIVVNRSLYESTTVNFAKLDDFERKKLLSKKDIFIDEYKLLMQNPEFVSAITANTNHIDNVQLRHDWVSEIIKKYIK